MRTFFIIALILTFSYASFGQADTITYIQFGDSSEFSKLNLNPDHTFQFHHYNLRSCWTWYSVQGTWIADKEQIVFTDVIHWEEDMIRMDTSVDNKRDYVLLTVKSDLGKPLKGIKIKYNLHLTDYKNTYYTDENGQIKIKKEILNKQKQKGYDDNVELAIQFRNRKSSNCSMSAFFESHYDKIDITIVDSPKEEKIVRTTVYRIIGPEIYFESQKYSVEKGYWQETWGNFRRLDERIITGAESLPGGLASPKLREGTVCRLWTF